MVQKVTGQHIVPIGHAVIHTLDTTVGCETYEELLSPLNPSLYMGLNGVEIFLLSATTLSDLKSRIDLVTLSSNKVGGVYVHSRNGCGW